MTEALINDRLEFVQLLLEKGLDIYKFLTDRRLENLYFASYACKNSFFSRLLRNLLGNRKVCLNSNIIDIFNKLNQVFESNDFFVLDVIANLERNALASIRCMFSSLNYYQTP